MLLTGIFNCTYYVEVMSNMLSYFMNCYNYVTREFTCKSKQINEIATDIEEVFGF